MTTTTMVVAADEAKTHNPVVNASAAPGSDITKGGWYQLDLRPGESRHQQIVLKNPNNFAVVANLEPVDAYTSNATGAAYGAPGSTPGLTGTWISVATRQLNLQAQEQRTIDFTVTVPANAQPGQYLAAVSASVPLDTSTATTLPNSGRNARFNVTLQPQRTIAVEVVVPGPRIARLGVRGASPVATPAGVAIQLDLANDGNAFAKGKGLVQVDSTQTRREFKIDTFLARTAIQYKVPWTTSLVSGRHRVTVRLEDNDGRVTTWSGTLDITGTAQEKLASDLAKIQTRPADDGMGTMTILALAFALVAIIVAVTLRVRRRRLDALVPISAHPRQRVKPSSPRAGEPTPTSGTGNPDDSHGTDTASTAETIRIQ